MLAEKAGFVPYFPHQIGSSLGLRGVFVAELAKSFGLHENAPAESLRDFRYGVCQASVALCTKRCRIGLPAECWRRDCRARNLSRLRRQVALTGGFFESTADADR